MDIFRAHSIQLTKKALRVCNVIFAMERFLGDIHPRTGLAAYSARVNSVLTYGAQIVVITADSTLRHLEKVQVAFLRRLLHVHKRSMTAILFSETGFTPIRYRRLILTLRYLLRLLSERTTSKLAPLGLDVCIELGRLGKRNWLSDIITVLERLYHPILVDIRELLSSDRVHELVTLVDNMWKDEIVDLITGSPTTSLLAHRFALSHAPSAVFRLYLDIRIPAHRIALTRALTGTHDLAIERGKWVGLARQWRLCRMCHDDVEDVIHVLFMCNHDSAVQLRKSFFSTTLSKFPALMGLDSPESLFHRLIDSKDLVEPTARFVCNMFSIWKSVPLF